MTALHGKYVVRGEQVALAIPSVSDFAAKSDYLLVGPWVTTRNQDGNSFTLAQVISSLSARVAALEGAVAALADQRRIDQKRALARFDKFAEELIDRYVAMPVDEEVLDFFRTSFADVRTLIGPTA